MNPVRELRRVRGHIGRARFERRVLAQKLGYTPSLIWPRSFNEKLLRRKLRRPPPSWSELADKIRAKEIVSARIGAEYVTRTHQIIDDADQIVLASLPSRFAAKAAHASGWNRFVRGRADDPAESALRECCRDWLGRRYGDETHETWYCGVPPRVLIEELLVDDAYGVPLDYKFWVFHGRVEYVQVDFDRFGHSTRTMYDRDWNPQSWRYNRPQGPVQPRPGPFGEMIEVAETLAGATDFVRIDLYCVNGTRICFGEFTFLPAAGRGRFWPDHRPDFAVGRLW